MAKTKISEFSATPANNTDIDGINIAEGCAPSGINNAIRELMSQLKDQQAGTAGDSFTVGGDLIVTGDITGDINFTNSPTVPTVAVGDDTTKIASTAFVTATMPISNGIAVRTDVGTSTARTLIAGAGISISDGDGVADNPVISNSGVLSVNSDTGDILVPSFDDFDNSRLLTNGYQKFPTGFIMQWGVANLPGSTDVAIDYPIPFPNACFSFQVTIGGSSPSSIGSPWIKSKTETTTTLRNVTGTNIPSAYWVAIGG